MNHRTTLQGIDVSHWAGKINFRRVKNSGIRLVYIKATEGTDYIDPDFERNYRDAHREELGIGFYHYVTARSTNDAMAEARFFASQIRDKIHHARAAMDFESFGDLSTTQVREISLRFLETLEREFRYRPVLYSDASNASTRFADRRLIRYPLWIADYDVRRPDMENPWSEWNGWQYTDQGRVRGISGDVDRDHFRKEILIDDGRGCDLRVNDVEERESAQPGDID